MRAKGKLKTLRRTTTLFQFSIFNSPLLANRRRNTGTVPLPPP
jgi:hypothetical protein